MSDILTIDKFEPDYSHECEVCGQKPVVTGVKDGKVVYESDMCGPCTWGESKLIDPSKWNE
jgi:hypothetical protein